jgi:hypothetical protein
VDGERKRQVVTVRLDDAGAVVVDDDPAVEIGERVTHAPRGDFPDPPIKIYIKQGDDQLAEIEAAPEAQKQAIVDAVARHEGADTLEFAIGEAGEPALIEVTDGIEAAGDLGLLAQLRLPQ